MTTLNAHDYTVGEILTAATMDGVTADLNTLLAEVEGSCYIETGTYTGDGTTDQTITLTDTALVIKYIRIIRSGADGQTSSAYTSTDNLNDNDADGLMLRERAADFTILDNGILSIGTGNFHVDDGGNDGHPNTNSVPYEYMVIGTH